MLIICYCGVAVFTPIVMVYLFSCVLGVSIKFAAYLQTIIILFSKLCSSLCLHTGRQRKSRDLKFLIHRIKNGQAVLLGNTSVRKAYILSLLSTFMLMQCLKHTIHRYYSCLVATCTNGYSSIPFHHSIPVEYPSDS